MTIRAVFFDVGGTLIRPYPSVGALYAQAAARYGLTVPDARMQAAFSEEFAVRGTLGERGPITDADEREWWRGLVAAVVGRFGRIDRFDAFFTELYGLFARPEAWRVFTEVPGVLEALARRGLVLGVVSNWDSRLRPLLESLGLARHFSFILASAPFGYAKPDRRIFDEAVRLSGVRPDEALHVGDSVSDDYQGALRAGLAAALVDRRENVQAGAFSDLRGLPRLV